MTEPTTAEIIAAIAKSDTDPTVEHVPADTNIDFTDAYEAGE